MVDIVKALFQGAVPTTTSNVYDVPSGKYAVVKSAVICNASATTSTIRLIVGGAYFAYNHTIKPYDTLVLDELDIPLLAGENITIMSSVSGVSILATGFERDYVSGEYPYVKSNLTLPNGTSVQTPPNEFDAVIKSIIICNSTLQQSTTINLGHTSNYLIANKTLKSGDTLLLPLPKIFVGKNKLLNFSSSGAIAYATVVMEKVVQ